MTNHLMQFFLNYWHQWNRRERIMVSFTACLLLSYLFYVLIETPLNTALTQAQAQIHENQSTLNWITRMHNRLKTVRPAQHVSTSALLGILNDKLSAHPVLRSFPAQLTQHANNQVMLKFEKVPFTILINWLWQLNKAYYFEIKQFQARRTEIPGVVTLSCVLEL